MRTVTALLALVPLLASCAATPVRWAGEARIVSDPPPAPEPAAACAAPSAAPSADRRWSPGAGEAVEAPPGRAPILRITSGPAEGSAAAEPPFPDRAYAAYLRELGRLSKTAAEFKAAAAPASPPPPRLDYTALRRVVSLAVHRAGYHPGDRFERLQIIVAAENFRFAGPPPATTRFEIDDIGRLTEARSLAATASGPSSGASVGGSASRSETYERDLTSRRQDQDLTVGPDGLSLYREGSPGRELTGAIALPLTLTAPSPDAVVERPVIVAFRAPAREQPGLVAAGVLRTLAVSGPLYVCGRIRYVDRRVVAGAKYLDESRQTVEVAEGETRVAPFEVAAAEDLHPPLWTISNGRDALAFETSGTTASAFLSRADAEAALAWAETAGAPPLAGVEVRLGSAPFRAGRDRLTVEPAPLQGAAPNPRARPESNLEPST